ncbi:uncharacterized protein LOC141964932 [Athene noctua]|uniref:uncharacterized protein LOC141964932 n=1 Tax=Athene noctua TaxID=126797 RepID=UPI003EBD0063
MGSTLSKEEAAVVKLLQHILSKRGLSYDEGNLRKLLSWARQRGLIPSVSAAFELVTWDKIGAALWEDISSGSMESVKFSTLWRLIQETLKDMKVEQQATDSTFAALSAEAESSKESATSMMFAGPIFPKAVPGKGKGTVPQAASMLLPSSRRENREQAPVADPPSTPPKISSPPESLIPSPRDQSPERIHPPLPLSSPLSPQSLHEEHRHGFGDSQLQDLIRKLEQLEMRMQELARPVPTAPPPPTFPNNPFLQSNMELGGQEEALAAGLPPPSTQMLGGALGDMGGNSNPAHPWWGVIGDAVIEGQFNQLGPTAFPVVAAPPGNAWEALDWKMIKEAKLAVTQYGLKSPYTTSVIQYIFTANLLTPYDVRMIIQTLLTASQQLQFFHHWQEACEAAAATPRQQGDPLYGVQSQMLLGSGPFANPDWQAGVQPEVLRLAQELALKAILAMHNEKVTLTFTRIKQGPTEHFPKFICRLRAAINSNPDLNKEMKVKFLDVLAYENANEKTKKALSLLPRGFTDHQLLGAAERMLDQEKAAFMAAAVGAAVKLVLQGKSSKEKKSKKCFNCGKLGHFKAQCHSPLHNGVAGVPRQRKWCKQCQKDNHNTNECRKKRNGTRSTPCPRTTTQVQGAQTAAPLPPLEV